MPGETPPFVATAEQVLSRLGVEAANGLSGAEASRRFEETGPNRLRAAERRGWWPILLSQFQSPVVVLLLVAAAAAAAFGEMVEGAAIAAALVINAAIGFTTEWRARLSMEALQRMGQATATVRRDGRVVEIPAVEVVPGDIVRLTEGEMVPADLRLVEVENLQCNESALTGESAPVDKRSAPLRTAEAALAERWNMAYSGTAVARGAAEGVVVATAMATELGRIAELVEGAEEEVTPLERRLERLAKRLIYLVLIIGVAVAASGIVAGKELFLMVETAIVLAIAAVPEGLPIVSTVALGRGMWRMAQRNALVKRLSAVETLGATTVIFSDKTGTLTENRMAVRRITLADGEVELTSKSGRGQSRSAEANEHDPLYHALRVGALCSNGRYVEGAFRGDPTETALLEAAAAAGLWRSELLEELPELREESFDAETQKMATYHQADDRVLVAVKGAPEALLEVCVRVSGKQGPVSLGGAERQQWHAENERLASQGLRVIALAEKWAEDARQPPYEGLTLLGLAGLDDPPREGVKEAIGRCREAGVRVVMVTGDQPATAANIARAVGIVDHEEPVVVSGRELTAANDGDGGLGERISRAAVFARVAPEQKLGLVRAYQQQGHVVGMTGDGVNDAPALKKADIGIAMGRRGTEVARETSDIVLKDDAFETIVMAIEQGRTIFANIRKFVIFLLSGNLGQIIGVSAAAATNAPLPLLPLQILFLNLLLDVFPALAIGVGESGGAVMQRPPRDPKEPILGKPHWLAILGFGLLMAITLLGVFGYALLVMRVDPTVAVTMAFLAYGFARLWHTFNMRSARSGLFNNEMTRNPFVWGAILLCGVLLAAAVYVPGLAALLKVTPPSGEQWLVVLSGSLLPLALGQAALFVLARSGRDTGD